MAGRGPLQAVWHDLEAHLFRPMLEKAYGGQVNVPESLGVCRRMKATIEKLSALQDNDIFWQPASTLFQSHFQQIWRRLLDITDCELFLKQFSVDEASQTLVSNVLNSMGIIPIIELCEASYFENLWLPLLERLSEALIDVVNRSRSHPNIDMQPAMAIGRGTEIRLVDYDGEWISSLFDSLCGHFKSVIGEIGALVTAVEFLRASSSAMEEECRLAKFLTYEEETKFLLGMLNQAVCFEYERRAQDGQFLTLEKIWEERDLHLIISLYCIYSSSRSRFSTWTESITRAVQDMGKDLVISSPHGTSELDVVALYQRLPDCIHAITDIEESFVASMVEHFSEKELRDSSGEHWLDAAVTVGLKSVVERMTRNPMEDVLPDYLTWLLRNRRPQDRNSVMAAFGSVGLVAKYLPDKAKFMKSLETDLEVLVIDGNIKDARYYSILLKTLKRTFCLSVQLEDMLIDLECSDEIYKQYRKHLSCERSRRRKPTAIPWNKKLSANMGHTSELHVELRAVRKDLWSRHERLICRPHFDLEQQDIELMKFLKAHLGGKNVEICPFLSIVTIESAIFCGGNKSVEIQLSHSQATILALLDNWDACTFEKICESLLLPGAFESKTRLHPKKVLAFTLRSLMNPYPLLKKTNGNEEFHDQDIVSLNDNFVSNDSVLKVPPVTMKIEDGITEESSSEICTEDWKHIINAAIVKLLKVKRKVTHKILVEEMQRKFESKSQAIPRLVKYSIENLISTGTSRRIHERLYCLLKVRSLWEV